VHRDPDIFPKIDMLKLQHGVDAADVIALLAVNALADVDMDSLSFWASISDASRTND
jgi:hypothetical protein